MTKRLLRQSSVSTLPAILDMSAALQALAHHTGEYRANLARLVDRGEGRK